MNTAEQKEKELWEAWLDDKYDNSSKKLNSIRNSIEKLYEYNKKSEGDLPYFTLHDTSHCRSVEDMLHKLIKDDKHECFTTREKYYLLVSAWVHDIGMLPYVASKVYKNEPPLDEYEVRKRHHFTSEQYIVNYWFELEIEEIDKEVIGKLVRFHRRCEDINDCDEVVVVRNEMIRLRLLASYLRLADALDISVTRAPAEYYALCLAYNMSDDSKYHWIKSRLVVGVYPDEKNHIIRVTFKYPKEEYLSGYIDYATAKEKLDKVSKMVVEDLRDELMSVMNVITKADISYYLDIEAVQSAVCYDEKMMNDLREIVVNYDIMGAPSDSKLLEFILGAIANIVGFSLRKDAVPLKFESARQERYSAVKNKLMRFLDVIEKRVIKNRPYPVGLINAIDEIRKYNKIDTEDKGDEWDSFIALVDKKYKDHLIDRGKIRDNSNKMFENIYGDKRGEKVVLLLYGFSELVTKSVCGLRDKLMGIYYGAEFLKNNFKLHYSDLEEDVSDKIMIYVCECQPKTQTYFSDRVIYHDGSQYALHLRKYGFKNIVIIPDIMAAALVEKTSVDFLIIGANGLSENYFIHSPGLSSIVKIVKAANEKKNIGTKVILVTMSDKYDKNKIYEEKKVDAGYEIVEGNYFYCSSELGQNRKNIWMCRDSLLMKSLFKEKIAFSNPLEDEIEYRMVDYMITEKGWIDNNGKDLWFINIIN